MPKISATSLCQEEFLCILKIHRAIVVLEFLNDDVNCLVYLNDHITINIVGVGEVARGAAIFLVQAFS